MACLLDAKNLAAARDKLQDFQARISAKSASPGGGSLWRNTFCAMVCELPPKTPEPGDRSQPISRRRAPTRPSSESMAMSDSDAPVPSSRPVLAVACPGGMARQYRVQVADAASPSQWRLVGSFREADSAK